MALLYLMISLVVRRLYETDSRITLTEVTEILENFFRHSAEVHDPYQNYPRLQPEISHNRKYLKRNVSNAVVALNIPFINIIF